MQRRNTNTSNSRIYGSVVKLSGKRSNPYAVRLAIGYDCNGYAVYEFLDTFDNELDAELCRREYSKNPYNLYIKEEKFKKIVKFTKLPSKVLIDNEENRIDRSKYTFAEIFEEWKKIYFPTKKEIQIEEITHKKTKGKLGKANRGNLLSAYNNSKDLHDKIYCDLRKINFESQINSVDGKRSKLYNMRNLYNKLDQYALEMGIIQTSYAQFIAIDCDEEETSRIPYSFEEIEFLWTLEGNQDIDILLCLLYNCMRIEELLELQIENINFKNGYMIGGLKTENGKNRIIPVHSKIEHIFSNYYEKNKNNKYLFTDENGNKINYKDYYYRFCKFKEDNKENFSKKHVVHETRHTARSEMDRRGANKKCMDLLMRT